MKTSIAKQDNIILIDEENFANLERISKKNKVYVYKLKYMADVSKMFQAKKKDTALQVIIQILKNEPKKKDIQVFEQGLDPDTIIDKLLSRSSNRKDLKRSKKLNVILAKKSDITKKISNSSTAGLSRVGFNDSVDDFSVIKKTEIKTVSIEDVEDAGVVAPILETNLNKIVQEGSDQEIAGREQDIQKKSLELLFLNGIDPAEFVGEKSNALVSARSQYTGVASKQSRLVTDVSNKNNIDSLVRPLLRKTIAAQHREINNIKFVNIPMKSTQTFVEVEETLRIPMDSLKENTFIVELDLISGDGESKQRLTQTVNHSEQLVALQALRLPPTIIGVPIASEGKNLLRLKQLDPYATRLNIYKKRLTAYKFSLDSPYEQIETVRISKEDGERMIEDIGVGTSPVLYRAVPVGIDGELGGIFSGTVVFGPRTKTALKENFFRRPSFLTLSHEIQEKTVVLFIDNIVNGPIALEVFRRDLTIKQKNFDKVGDTVLLSNTNERPIQVHDNQIKPNRLYEYMCKLLYGDGASLKAGNNLTVEYVPSTNNIVSIETSNLSITEGNEDINVTFDITKRVILNNLDIVKSFLLSQGITEYDTDVESNKEKLQNLFFIRVLRFNLLSGEVEDFGVIDTLSFSDQDQGKVKNVSSLRAGLSYKYALIAYARAAETLMPTITRTVQTHTNQSYELLPSKFLHPVTLQDGNLVTDSSLLRNHANSPFTLGKVVDIKYFKVDLGKYTPTIQDVRAKKINKKTILLRWKILGDATRIDHFIIVLESNGIRTIVGKAHAIGETNEFQFVDTLDNGEHGALEYAVIPVFFDFSRGAEQKSEQIVI